jgi:riboflavin biosynthesis pyrimidine reductase
VTRIDSLFPSAASDLDDAALTALYSRPDRTKPWLRVNFVSSIDGAATRDGVSGGLGGDADHRVFDLLRRLCDVVLVAAGTVRAEGYGPMRVDAASVAARVAAGLTPHPVFAILSGSLDLDPSSRIFLEAPIRPIVVTTGASPHSRRTALEDVADVLVCGDHELDAAAMVAAFAERGLPQVHCEGGPSLFGSLLEADVVDELCLTLSPLLDAGESGRIAHSAAAAGRGMSLGHVLESESTLLLRYLRSRSAG